MTMPGAAPEARGQPDLWWRVLAEQRGFIIVFVLSAVLTALALTYVLSEKYEASADISYRVQEVTRFKAQQSESLGSPAPQAPFKVIGSTLQEVLRSDAILRDVVLAMKLHVPEPVLRGGPWYRQWYVAAKEWVKEVGGQAWSLMKYGRIVEDDPVDAAVEELRTSIRVTNRDSYVFQLAVRDRNPERAARVVDHLSGVLANWLLEADRRPGRDRADQLRVLLDQKGEELARRRRDIEALLNDNRVLSVQQDGAQFTEQMFSLQTEVLRLNSEIARARARLAQVEAKLELKRRLLAQLAQPAGSTSAAPPPGESIAPEDFKKLASEQVFQELELKSLVAKRDTLQESVEKIADRLRRMPGVQRRFDTLKMELDAIEREFTLINDGYQEASVRATTPVSEVRVLHAARVPARPVSPIKIYHVLLAAGLGLPLAIGLVYMLDFLGMVPLLAPRRRAVPVSPPPPPPPAAGATEATPQVAETRDD